MTEWYYADRQRRQIGPQPAEHLVQRFRVGEIDAATLVWREGMPAWQPLGSLRTELGLDEAPATLDFRAPADPLPPAGERGQLPPGAAYAARGTAFDAGPVQDGPVAGVALGIIPATGEPRYTLIRERDDTLFTLKAEGLCLDESDPARAWTVVDLDNPDEPSLLCELRLDGPWNP